MKKITSAYANKWLKSLEEDKEYWINKEEASSTYVAAINEEPVIPEYDYAEVAATIAEIDEKIAVIKHALNVTNATAKVQVKDTGMSVDTILIKMAQLNKRKAVLDRMRKQLPKTRDAKYPAPEAYKVALAGNDLFMPGSQQEIDNLTAALKNGHITREELIKNATRICRMAVELAGASV